MSPYSILKLTGATLLIGAAATARAGSIDRVLPASPNGVVEISNIAGEVSVQGWDRPEVTVRGEYNDNVERIDVTGDHGHIIIKAVITGYRFHSSEAILQIQIPKASELNVSTVDARVKSRDVQGVQRLKTISGEIDADIGRGPSFDANSVSGEIRLRGHGSPVDLHVGTISGEVQLERGSGSVEITNVSGEMVIGLDAARSVRIRTTSGDLSLQGNLAKDANVDIESVSGDVKVQTNIDGGFDYDLSSFSGDINNCFHVEPEKPKYGPGSRLRGERRERGDGGARVRMKTMSGDITLCDKS